MTCGNAAIAYWTLLYDTVAACQPTATGEAEILRRCAAAWGTIYGIARLAALGQIPKAVPGDLTELLHEAVDTLYEGWQADDRASATARTRSTSHGRPRRDPS